MLAHKAAKNRLDKPGKLVAEGRKQPKVFVEKLDKIDETERPNKVGHNPRAERRMRCKQTTLMKS